MLGKRLFWGLAAGLVFAALIAPAGVLGAAGMVGAAGGAAGAAGAAGDFSAALSGLARRLTSPLQGVVVGTEKDQVYINLGEKDGVRGGDVFQVARLGEAMVHGGKTYRKEQPLGRLSVVRVRGDMTIAKAENPANPPQTGDYVYMKKSRVGSIALGEFPYLGGFNRFSGNVASRLSILLMQKGFSLVEPARLQKALTQQGAAMARLGEAAVARKVGGLLGVEAVLAGDITDLQDSLSINARLVNVATGEVISAAFAELAKSPRIKAMLELKNQPPAPAPAVQTAAAPAPAPAKKPKAAPPAPAYDGLKWKVEVPWLENQGQTMVAMVRITSKLENPIVAEIRFSRDLCTDTYLVDDQGGCHGILKTLLMKPHDFFPGVPRLFKMTFKAPGELGRKYILKLNLKGNRYGEDLEAAVMHISLGRP